MAVTVVVEGDVDAAVARRVGRHAAADVHRVLVKGGKHALLKGLPGYAAAAAFADWFVLIDLDRDADCAPAAIRQWLEERPERLCLRVAVRAVESWLLADAEALARFLGVGPHAIPAEPDAAEDPKGLLVNAARRSRRRAIREGMVPRESSGRAVGSAYTSNIIEFVAYEWSPARAMTRSDSLRRCVERISAMVRPIERNP